MPCEETPEMCTLPKIGGPDHPLTPSLTKEGDFGPPPGPLLNQGGELRFFLLKGPGYALHSVRRLLLLTRSTLLARQRSRGRAQPAAGAA